MTKAQEIIEADKEFFEEEIVQFDDDEFKELFERYDALPNKIRPNLLDLLKLLKRSDDPLAAYAQWRHAREYALVAYWEKHVTRRHSRIGKHTKTQAHYLCSKIAKAIAGGARLFDEEPKKVKRSGATRTPYFPPFSLALTSELPLGMCSEKVGLKKNRISQKFNKFIDEENERLLVCSCFSIERGFSPAVDFLGFRMAMEVPLVPYRAARVVQLFLRCSSRHAEYLLRHLEALLRNLVNSQVLQVSGVGYFSVRSLGNLIKLEDYGEVEVCQ